MSKNNTSYIYAQAVKAVKDDVEAYQFNYHSILAHCFNEHEEPPFRDEEINRRLSAERTRLINDLNKHIEKLEKLTF